VFTWVEGSARYKDKKKDFILNGSMRFKTFSSALMFDITSKYRKRQIMHQFTLYGGGSCDFRSIIIKINSA
jgi:hypothetical protein